MYYYKLELDFEFENRYNRFYTNLLRPAPVAFYPGHVQAKPPAIGIDENGEKIWAIEALVDSRRTHGRFEYLVVWRGYGEDRTWEPLSSFVRAFAVTREYHRRFPKKPKPSKDELKEAKITAKEEARRIRTDATKDKLPPIEAVEFTAQNQPFRDPVEANKSREQETKLDEFEEELADEHVELGPELTPHQGVQEHEGISEGLRKSSRTRKTTRFFDDISEQQKGGPNVMD